MAGLLRTNIGVAAGTATSRLTGLARVAVVGAVLGTPSAVADAYDLANSTPNMIYELLLGGVLSSTLVPLLTRLRDDGDDAGTRAVVAVATAVLGALTLVAVAAAPLVFGLYSVLTADTVDADRYRAVGTALTRMFLVQIFFYGLTAIGSALLAAHRRFLAAAWSPVVSNLVVIVSLAFVPRVVSGTPTLDDVLDDRTLRWLLGGGATIGIAVGSLALLPALRTAGVRVGAGASWRHPAVRSLRTMSLWALGYVAANQIALVVVRNLLRGGDGSAFAYSRAFLWFMLPHALLAMPIVTTFQPDLASASARNDDDALAERAATGVRLVALLTIPAGVGLFVLRRPIIGLVFQHGDATAADAALTARALGGFALGLGAFSVYLFVLRIFYSRFDARTPFLLNVVENLVNIVLAVALVGRYGLAGLAASFAIAYAVGATTALLTVARRLPAFSIGPLVGSIARTAAAAVVMGLAVAAVGARVGGEVGTDAAVRVAAGTATGVVVYLIVSMALGADDIGRLIRARAGRRGG